MSNILGRIGNVAGALLENQLKTEEKQREESELYRRQLALQQSGVLSTMAEKIGTAAAAGQPVDLSKLPPEMRSMVSAYGSIAPTPQQKVGKLITDWGGSGEHGIKSPEGLTREEVIAQLQGVGVPTSDVYDLSKQRQFSDAEGTYGNGEEGLLPAYTRGAYEENPLLTQAGTAAGAIGGRVGKANEAARLAEIDKAVKIHEAENPPKSFLSVQQTAQGAPAPEGTMVYDEAAGGFRRTRPGEHFANPELHYGMPQTPNIYTNGPPPADQNKLEQQAHQTALRSMLAVRSALGVEQQKLYQADHLDALYQQYTTTDPRTGQTYYNIPPTAWNELAMGAARLISPTGVPTYEMQRDLKAATGFNDFANIAMYLSGSNVVPANSQELQAMFKDIIDRQKEVSATHIDDFYSGVELELPSELEPERAQRVMKGIYTAFPGGHKAKGEQPKTNAEPAAGTLTPYQQYLRRQGGGNAR